MSCFLFKLLRGSSGSRFDNFEPGRSVLFLFEGVLSFAAEVLLVLVHIYDWQDLPQVFFVH